jgi:hypothetical protein
VAQAEVGLRKMLHFMPGRSIRLLSTDLLTCVSRPRLAHIGPSQISGMIPASRLMGCISILDYGGPRHETYPAELMATTRTCGI